MIDPKRNGTQPFDDEEILTDLKRKRDEAKAEIAALTDRVAAGNVNLKRYQRAITALEGAPPPNPQRRRSPQRSTGARRPSGVSETRADGTRFSISEERVTMVERAIRELDQDEFRQVDIRARLNMSSGVVTQAFEVLRQRRVIRFARRAGSQKFYRLTREALNVDE